MSSPSRIDDYLVRHRGDPTRLLQALRLVQEDVGWVPPAMLTRVSAALAVPRAVAQGVAEFYSFLAVRPVGRYRILFSDNITDRMQGAPALRERLCERLGVRRGVLSGDARVSIDTTSCTGMCDQGPAALLGGRPLTRLDELRIDRIAEYVRAGIDPSDWPAEWFRVEDNIRQTGPLLSSALAAGAVVAAVRARSAGALLDELERAGLRGRGGAGFATGPKWRACREAPGGERHVVCNADEGEPGTFKDRVLLTRQAELVFDGMTACAMSIGARHGILYLRGEYAYLRPHLEAVLAARRDVGLLGGEAVSGTGPAFDIEIQLGAGAYVCGEESALIESLEGKRGVPRNRPPYPVTVGYRGAPTVVNNVETFAAAAWIAVHGAAAWRAFGTAASSGTKLLSVAGDVGRPGIYELPFGVALSEVLSAAGGEGALAAQVSGPSGQCVPAAEFGRCIAFEDLPTAGALTVFGPQRDPFEIALAYTEFFAHESCGFCTPCRVGTALLARTMRKLARGGGSGRDLEDIQVVNRTLQAGAHCGLGHSACNPILDTLRHFPDAYSRRLQSAEFEPGFDLDAALAPARAWSGRDDPGAHLEGRR